MPNPKFKSWRDSAILVDMSEEFFAWMMKLSIWFREFILESGWGEKGMPTIRHNGATCWDISIIPSSTFSFLQLRGHSITMWTRRGGKGSVESPHFVTWQRVGRYHVKFNNCPLEGGGRQNCTIFGPRSWWMTPKNQAFSLPKQSVSQVSQQLRIANQHQ